VQCNNALWSWSKGGHNSITRRWWISRSSVQSHILTAMQHRCWSNNLYRMSVMLIPVLLRRLSSSIPHRLLDSRLGIPEMLNAKRQHQGSRPTEVSTLGGYRGLLLYPLSPLARRWLANKPFYRRRLKISESAPLWSFPYALLNRTWDWWIVPNVVVHVCNCFNLRCWYFCFHCNASLL